MKSERDRERGRTNLDTVEPSFDGVESSLTELSDVFNERKMEE